MLLLAVSVLVGLYSCMLWLLRQRRLPVTVMRAWFTLHLTIAVFAAHVGCRIVSFLAYTLHLMPTSTAQAMSRICKQVAFKGWLGVNIPHVRLQMMPGSLPYSVLNEGVVCSCHCSFFDSLFFLWIVPFSMLWRSRTFLKSSLRNLPVLGYVLRCTGHFPVYFADESSASFSVNKEKQAAVAVEVEKWVSEGNSICFFPEGVMNRAPEVLKDFRLGTFNTVLKHKMPLYYVVVYGNHEVWSPSFKGMPGFPADVYTYVGKYEYDPAKVDAVSLAKGLRDGMQKHLDDMMVRRKNVDYKPWYVPPHKD